MNAASDEVDANGKAAKIFLTQYCKSYSMIGLRQYGWHFGGARRHAMSRTMQRKAATDVLPVVLRHAADRIAETR